MKRYEQKHLINPKILLNLTIVAAIYLLYLSFFSD